MPETAANFEGHEDRECGEHRTVGPHRAWCHDCSMWCYPDDPCRGCELSRLRETAATNGALYGSAESDVSAVHALVARWEQGVTNLYAANEEETVPETATIRAARAAQIECCIHELRDALSAHHTPAEPVSSASTATEVSGGAGEAQEGSQ